ERSFSIWISAGETSLRTRSKVARSIMAPPLTATISPAEIATRAKSPRPSIGLLRFSVLGLNQLLITHGRCSATAATVAEGLGGLRVIRGRARGGADAVLDVDEDLLDRSLGGYPCRPASVRRLRSPRRARTRPRAAGTPSRGTRPAGWRCWSRAPGHRRVRRRGRRRRRRRRWSPGRRKNRRGRDPRPRR